MNTELWLFFSVQVILTSSSLAPSPTPAVVPAPSPSLAPSPTVAPFLLLFPAPPVVSDAFALVSRRQLSGQQNETLQWNTLK